MINVLIYAAYGAALFITACLAFVGVEAWRAPITDWPEPDPDELIAIGSGHYDLEADDDDAR